jgi:hypothetical protein
MPKTRGKQNRASTSRAAARPKGSKAAADTKAEKSSEEAAFTRSLVVHDQAAKPLPDGSLPRGATHELVEDAKGEVKAVRRRFSAF